MAGEWIKMRASLFTNPKVLMISEILIETTVLGETLNQTSVTQASRSVTQASRERHARDAPRDAQLSSHINVIHDVTIACLLRIWCAANEHTEDGTWQNSTLRTLDNLAGLSGFGDAMVRVGWAIYDHKRSTITLPNFLEYNSPFKGGSRSVHAERQKRYRERKKNQGVQINGYHAEFSDEVPSIELNVEDQENTVVQSTKLVEERDVTRDVTGDVTRYATRDVTRDVTLASRVTHREEKKEERGICSDLKKPSGPSNTSLSPGKPEENGPEAGKGSPAKPIEADFREFQLIPVEAPEKPVVEFQLISGEMHQVYPDRVAEWLQAFPAADVRGELLRMRVWFKDNPKKRKSKAGIGRFITLWMSRAHDKGTARIAPANQSTNWEGGI